MSGGKLTSVNHEESGSFLSIPNEKIVEDFKKIGIKPITGRYFRPETRFSEMGCCPISCQLLTAEKAHIDDMRNYLLGDVYIEELAKKYWPDLNEKDDEFTNLTLFLHGFDNITIERQNPYLKKGRELRALLFNNEGAIS